MDIIQIVLSYVAKQHGMTEDAVAELICKKSEDGTKIIRTEIAEDALKTLLAKDKERVEKLKGDQPDKAKIFDEAFNKAKKEELGKVEKLLAEKFDLDLKLKLPELVDAIAVIKAPTGVELTEENIKKHPVFVKLERDKTAELKAAEKKYADELEGIKSKQSKEVVLNEVTSKVLTYFDALKPVLSTDPAKASNQRSDFANKFKSFSYEKIEGSDDFVILDETGKRIDDGHGNAIGLKAFAEQKAASYYDFAKQDPKGNAGNAGGTGATTTVPTNEDEYLMAILNSSSAEDRAALKTAWDAKSGGA